MSLSTVALLLTDHNIFYFGEGGYSLKDCYFSARAALLLNCPELGGD
jgi:hypothetical protein